MAVTYPHKAAVLARLVRPRGPVRWIRAFVIALAVLTIGSVAASAVIASAVYDGRMDRALARSGQMTESEAVPPMALLATGWEFIDHQYIGVYYYVRVDPGAPPPPGLTEWPDPGQIAVSAALKDLDEGGLIAARYGPIAAVIDRAALVSPGERLLYVFRSAEQVDESSFVPISAWHGGGSVVGEILYQQPLTTFLAAMVPFPLIGGVVLAVGGARLGDRDVGGALRVLERIGASPWQRARAILAGNAWALLAGATAAVALAAWAVTSGLHLPMVGFEILASDLRPHAGAVVAAAAVGCMVAACAVALASARRHQPTRVRKAGRARQRSRFGSAALCVTMLGALIPIALLSVRTDLDWAQPVILFATVAITVGILVTLPGLIDAILGLAVRGLSAWVRRRGGAGQLIGVRQLERHRSASVRVGSVVAAGTVIVVLLSSVAMSFGVDRDAAATAAALDGHLVAATARDGRSSLHALDNLPSGFVAVDFWLDGLDSDTEIVQRATTSDEVLERLGLTAGSTIDQARADIDPVALDYLVSVGLGATPIETESAPAGGSLETYFFRIDGGLIDRVELAVAVTDEIAPLPVVETPGDSWLVGSMVAYDQARWLSFFGLVGVLLVLVGAFANTTAEIIRSADEIAPLTTVGIDRSAITTIIGVRLMPAVVIGLVLAVAASAVTAYPIRPSVYGYELPWAVILGTAAFAGLASLAVWWVVAAIVSTAARTWLPGQSVPDDLTI
ncbi:hypothetical protein [Xylanimonas protaetiae]|uniref:FtsX-like permease family protein n=1 Tax=Xylanimonas protaetiae TaxID=2509457 RepID=A0A4P6EZA2_9MICO|nr:hypothetical protein [Xylanimonas protaetiae]QAY68780.1 hypothetical protein ET471_00890 [Xylanimonas protaetiae]